MATDATFTTRRLAEQLRGWAAGLYGTEAAVELLIRAWAASCCPARGIRNEDSAVWFDPAGIDEPNHLSGGERRLPEVARSLASTRPVQLGDAVSGLGRHGLELIPAAIALPAVTSIPGRSSTTRACRPGSNRWPPCTRGPRRSIRVDHGQVERGCAARRRPRGDG
ncbi:hypothetical protein [Microlunatus parietis]|uniref:Uncharacterized protein n=1 Tax=Microlunatus parietis TaxID=682979 RepID=A0A7Y9I3E6_9ACTN|nr:hypothetical protein [Microlunatus parietis]NYE69487.1 hypothetical protein [Microlunatus parietis]